jgi:hypothetical protein
LTSDWPSFAVNQNPIKKPQPATVQAFHLENDMILIQCTQGSEEWHAARAGVITASMFKVARERLKSGPNKGDFTQAAKKYAFKLAIERISGRPLDEGFETWQMKRGHELEPMARARHEEEAGVIVETAGFVKTDDSCFGASADGLIGNDGGAEYKCLVSPDSLMPVLLENDIAEYIDQIQGCMWITGRKWWHFGLYCPALEPAKLDLYWKHIDRDDDYIEAMERDLIAFRALVLQYESTLRRKGSAANDNMLHKAA